MRDPVVALYVLCAVLVAASVAIASRRQGPRAAFLASGMQVLLAALAVLAFPPYGARYPDRPAQWIFVAVIVSLLLAVLVLAPSKTRPLERLASFLRARPAVANGALAMATTVLVLAGLEVTAASLTRLGLARRYTPTETRLAEQTEDWRMSHITSDAFREPDPVLLWRPVPRSPYTAQRFRGPTVDERKPPGTVRIICYGDSNTDGPLEGGAWPEALAEILGAGANADGGIAYEVLNAGVTGYSSYQGLRRLEQEIDRYRPDVVLVAFGWNDASTSISTEDKAFAQSSAFQSVNPWAVAARRVLFTYDAALVAARFVTPSRSTEQALSTSFGPRVSLDDYAANLAAMVARARASGALAVLMTRPHRESEDVLMHAPGWRQRVPGYNQAVRRVADAQRAPLVDVQREVDGRPALFVDESHFTREGHRTLAQSLYARLQELGIVREDEER